MEEAVEAAEATASRLADSLFAIRYGKQDIENKLTSRFACHESLTQCLAFSAQALCFLLRFLLILLFSVSCRSIMLFKKNAKYTFEDESMIRRLLY